MPKRRSPKRAGNYDRLESRRFLSANSPGFCFGEDSLQTIERMQSPPEFSPITNAIAVESIAQSTSVEEVAWMEVASVDAWFEYRAVDFFVETQELMFAINAFRQFEEAVFQSKTTPQFQPQLEPQRLSLSTFSDSSLVTDSRANEFIDTSAFNPPDARLNSTSSVEENLNASASTAQEPTTNSGAASAAQAEAFRTSPNDSESSQPTDSSNSQSNVRTHPEALVPIQTENAAPSRAQDSISAQVDFGSILENLREPEREREQGHDSNSELGRVTNYGADAQQKTNSVYSFVSNDLELSPSASTSNSPSSSGAIFSSVRTSSNLNLLAYTSLSTLMPLDQVVSPQTTIGLPVELAPETETPTQQLAALGRLLDSFYTSQLDTESSRDVVLPYGSSILIGVAAGWYYTQSRSKSRDDLKEATPFNRPNSSGSNPQPDSKIR